MRTERSAERPGDPDPAAGKRRSSAGRTSLLDVPRYRSAAVRHKAPHGQATQRRLYLGPPHGRRSSAAGLSKAADRTRGEFPVAQQGPKWHSAPKRRWLIPAL